MLDQTIAALLDGAERHRRLVLAGLLLITALGGVGLRLTRYEGSIELMLPPDREVRRSLDFLQDANLSDKTVVSLRLTDPARDRQELFQAEDQLAASLKPPLFGKVVSGVSLQDAMAELSVLQYAPQLLGEKDLARIDGELQPSVVGEKLRSLYRRALRPDALFTDALMRSDPLGIGQIVFEKLGAIPASLGYDVMPEDGHFVSRDGRAALMIVETGVPMMDSERSKELVAALQQRLRELPPFVAADVVGAHLHTVSNEAVVRRDILVASTIASIAFVLLLFFVFRDLRALAVFVIPLVAVVWAVPVCAAFHGALSYLVIGLGTAIAGISIDYGLLVYIAMKGGADSAQMVKLAKLVFIDAVTTVFSFLVLYVSAIRGYHQLALFSALCVAICLLISLVALPALLRGRGGRPASDLTIAGRLRARPWVARLLVGGWAVLTLGLLLVSLRVPFDRDVKRLDGSGPEVLDAERRFHETWGGQGEQALLVASGASEEQALQRNDALYERAALALGRERITSLAQFWPSQHRRAANRERWNRFWRDGREARLRRLLAEEGAPLGFAPSAFAPFFEGLYGAGDAAPRASGVLARLVERFVVKSGSRYRVMSFVPDDPPTVAKLAPVVAAEPDAFLVSGRALSASISALTARDLRLLAPLAVLFNVGLSWLFFRNLRETAIALVPVVTGVVWLVGLMSLFGVPLNVVSVVAAIVSTGVIVDYGLGITYEYRYDLRIGTIVAVTLSAATNVIGTGALLFAKHPALHSTGVAMVICMLAGYASAVVVIPSLCSLMARPGALEGSAEARGGAR